MKADFERSNERVQALFAEAERVLAQLMAFLDERRIDLAARLNALSPR